MVIECSGVAIPSASAASVTLLEGYASDGTVVLVDAETIRTAALDDYIGDTILRQVANADLAVINKADLVDVPTLSALESWLSNTAPRTKTIVSEHSKVPLGIALGLGATPIQSQQIGHADGLFDSIALLFANPLDG